MGLDDIRSSGHITCPVCFATLGLRGDADPSAVVADHQRRGDCSPSLPRPDECRTETMDRARAVRDLMQNVVDGKATMAEVGPGAIQLLETALWFDRLAS